MCLTKVDFDGEGLSSLESPFVVYLSVIFSFTFLEKEGEKEGNVATDGQDVAPGSERKLHVINVDSTSIRLREGFNISTPLDAPLLVIKPDVLKPGRTYKVQLNARYRGVLEP